MSRIAKTKAQLMAELVTLRQQVAAMEASETERMQAEQALQKSLKELDIAYKQALLFARELTTEVAERKRAEAELVQRNQELLMVQAMGADIAVHLDVRYILDTVTQEIVKLLNVEGCAISEWHPVDDTVVTIAEHGPETWKDQRSLATTYSLADFPLTKRVMEDRLAQQITVSQSGIDPAELAYMEAAHLKTLVMLPLAWQDRIIGLVEIEDSRVERMFAEQEIALVQLLINHAAIAIENARLQAETERRAQQLVVLHEFDQTVSASLRLEEVYQALARHTRRLLTYDHMFITRLEAAGLRVTYLAESQMPILPVGTLLSLKTSAAGWVVLKGQPLLRHHIYMDRPFAEDEQLRGGGLHSSIILPLRVKGQIIGTWHLYSQHVGNYDPDDLEMAQALADQLAIASENARLYEHARQEIAERKLAEEALRESEARYRTLVETSPDAIVLTDLQHTIVFCSQKTASLYGVEVVTEIMGKNVFELIAPEDLQRGLDNMRKILEVGSLNTVEYTLVTKNGLRFPGEVNTSVLLDRAEQPQGFISIIRDITERRRAEARLRLLESVVVNAKDAVLITEAGLIDPPGPSVLYANDAFTRMTGYSLEEILGQTPRMLQGPKTERGQLHKIREALVQQIPMQVELINYRKDGTEYWVELNIVPVADASGHLTHFVSVQREITERRHLEEQLRQSQKMEAIGRLAGGIAHDFNNLLTVINGHSELMLQTYLETDHPLRPDVEQIKKAGERAATLTRQLLAFSRKQIFHLEVLDLNEVVTDLEKMLRRLIGEDIELTTVLDPRPGSIKADRGQIEQVLMNLVVNARDAMPQGGKLIIETANAELDQAYTRYHFDVNPGAFVMLAVSDTGLGMSAEVQAHIFEPFFTTKELHKGTGLGLSTVYGIVKQSGGDIWVYSEPGRGTTFKVYLPRLAEAVEVPQLAPSAILARGSETVLLVEDETGVRELVRQVLTRSGYNVLDAGNGPEALAISEGHTGSIQLLLTDVVMPRMSGPELAKQLGQRHPQMKVLYMSGYTDDAIVQHGILGPGTAFLQKPFNLHVMIQKVREVLDQSPLSPLEKGG